MRAFLISLLILGLTSTSVLAQGYNLEQIISLGLKNNLNLKALKQGKRLQEYNQKIAQSKFYPKLDLSYGYRYKEKVRTLGPNPVEDQNIWALTLNLHQILFSGGYLSHNYQKEKFKTIQFQTEIKKAQLELSLQLKRVFFGILKAKALLKSLNHSIQRLKNHMILNQNLYKTGLSSKLSVSQTKSALAQVKTQLIGVKNLISTQKSLLKTLVNLPQRTKIELKSSLDFVPFLSPLDKCQVLALKQRPELKIIEQALKIASQEKEMAKSGFLPQIGADLTYNRFGNEPDLRGTPYEPPSNWQIQLGLKWNLFQGRETSLRVEQAKTNILRLKTIYTQQKRQILWEVESAYLELNSAKQAILAAKEALAAAKQTFELAKARYQNHLGTNTDVLDAQANLSKAESAYVQSLADYELALAKLEKAMGKL